MTTSHDPGGPLSGDPLRSDPVLGSTGSTSASGGSGAKDQAKQAAGTAADESGHVAGVAKDEVQQVASEAKDKLGDLFSEATSQLGEQSRVQMQRLVDKLKELSDEIDSMVDSSDAGGTVSGLAHQLSAKTRDLSDQLSNREPADLLEDVRGYARRRSGTFLLGATAAGALAGRLTRGAKEASSGGSQGSSTPRPDMRPSSSSYDATPAGGAPVDLGPATGSAQSTYPTDGVDESMSQAPHGYPTDPLAGEPPR